MYAFNVFSCICPFVCKVIPSMMNLHCCRAWISPVLLIIFSNILSFSHCTLTSCFVCVVYRYALDFSNGMMIVCMSVMYLVVHVVLGSVYI